MAKKVTLKKTVVKQSEEPLNVSSLTLDVSEEFILSRAVAREYLPTVSYVNDYLV
ncbi:hypothetical protein [Bacillus safensis]|uniref:hypothetical protein n=1 Tax=Bacillus safensis TaxID=561879 RepID=UPI000B15EBD8|nr:hypothetical protein [Bacillus safensis]